MESANMRLSSVDFNQQSPEGSSFFFCFTSVFCFFNCCLYQFCTLFFLFGVVNLLFGGIDNIIVFQMIISR